MFFVENCSFSVEISTEISRFRRNLVICGGFFVMFSLGDELCGGFFYEVAFFNLVLSVTHLLASPSTWLVEQTLF